jgi:hypothetical protein
MSSSELIQRVLEGEDPFDLVASLCEAEVKGIIRKASAVKHVKWALPYTLFKQGFTGWVPVGRYETEQKARQAAKRRGIKVVKESVDETSRKCKFCPKPATKMVLAQPMGLPCCNDHLNKAKVDAARITGSPIQVKSIDEQHISGGEPIPKPPALKQRFKEVGLAKDKKGGYFVYTHRARSQSYPSPEKIPLDKVKFIASTG